MCVQVCVCESLVKKRKKQTLREINKCLTSIIRKKCYFYKIKECTETGRKNSRFAANKELQGKEIQQWEEMVTGCSFTILFRAGAHAGFLTLSLSVCPRRPHIQAGFLWEVVQGQKARAPAVGLEPLLSGHHSHLMKVFPKTGSLVCDEVTIEPQLLYSISSSAVFQ